jgi:hypothetical protein
MSPSNGIGRPRPKWDAAVDVRSRFNDIRMSHEQEKQLAGLVDAVDEAWGPCVRTPRSTS